MPQTHLRFHRLTFVPEREGVTVGRADIDSYAVLPEDGADLLRRLTEGLPPEEAVGWYEATYGESIDLDDFLETLDELGFLQAEGEGDAPPVRLQGLGRALFSPVAWLLYAVVVAAGLVTMVRHPSLRPGAGDIYFVSSLLIVQVVMFVGQVPFIFLHEGAHMMAGRRLGLPTRLGVGRRMFIVVFETELNALHGVPKSKRYLPFLCGLGADLVLVSGLTLLASAGQPHWAPWVTRLVLGLAFTIVLRIILQFFVFLRTDPYFALTTALGCSDLAGASSAYLRSHLRARLPSVITGRIAWLNGDSGDLTQWPARDAALAPWFAGLTVAGAGIVCVFLLPALFTLTVTFVDRLRAGLDSGSLGGASFWDAAAALALGLAQAVVLPLLVGWRNRRNARRGTQG